jgi:hypothetical protein
MIANEINKNTPTDTSDVIGMFRNTTNKQQHTNKTPMGMVVAIKNEFDSNGKKSSIFKFFPN